MSKRQSRCKKSDIVPDFRVCTKYPRCSQFSIHRHCTFRFLQLDLLETRQHACRVIKVTPRFTSYELNMQLRYSRLYIYALH